MQWCVCVCVREREREGEGERGMSTQAAVTTFLVI